MIAPPSSNYVEPSATPARRGSAITWVVLVAGLIITTAVTLYIKASMETIAELEFYAQCREIHDKIKYRLNEHSRILQSGVAFFNASDSVSREDWRIFIESQKVEQQLPGILGIGFSLLITRDELSRHIQEVRSEGYPEYTVRPDGGERELYSSIIYLEPFSGRNLQAFGYDMFSEKIRRTAMERARDMDNAALSGKVVLVQEIDKEVQSGTLMYVPVYRKGMPAGTVEQRRAALYGWVYSPYRMNDLMGGILGERNLAQQSYVQLQIFDGESTRTESLLYATPGAQDEKPGPDSRFTRQVSLDFNGQRWTLIFTKIGGWFSPFDYLWVGLTIAGGMLITLLLFALVRVLVSAHAQAQGIVVERTAKLREREKLIGELQFALDEIKALQGILPICCYCKKIRNDDGYWEQVEAYITSHSQAEFSHSICPACLKTHYPEDYEGIMARAGQKK